MDPSSRTETSSLRFGLSASDARPGQEWTDLARRVEASGFDVLLVSDHLAPTLSPFASLAHAAAVTDRLRLGTLVLNNDLRHPVITAREAATLDVLSGGRLELGLGAGHMRHEYDEVGLPFDPPSIRVARLSEAVPAIRALLDGATVTTEGPHYRFDGHGLGFATVQDRLPLLVGGNGDRVLSLAAAHADIVGFTGFRHREADSTVQLSHFADAGLVERIEHVRTASGDRFADLELNLLVQRVQITDDAERVAAAMAERLEGITTGDVLGSPFLLVGTVEEIAAKVLDLRDRLGIGYLACFEPALDAMAEVISRCRA